MDMKSGGPWSLILAVLMFVLSTVRGEIRCYCNQAACISTSYMCKSQSLCYSDLERGIHGCLERRRCGGLRCCREDMCNYIHVNIHVHTHRAPMADIYEDNASLNSEKIALMESTMNRETWFKAAVIAVPIVGLCILILLALFAAKMLREDAMRQRRLQELHRIYGHSLKDNLLPWNKEKNTTIV
ncbi:BMP and activin membrane-bound inhibitor homolog [Stegodyphus dumicola]|uniref:BMP and activin membrane-bound inhibitor homolog n=1 Tax=Stegodyphus dumicola TaxID=202533 RepID=UPI0015AB7DC7|nr:BMP and activin membrane-bound inhibitor homolog [Stegodyphus dumicola]